MYLVIYNFDLFKSNKILTKINNEIEEIEKGKK